MTRYNLNYDQVQYYRIYKNALNPNYKYVLAEKSTFWNEGHVEGFYCSFDLFYSKSLSIEEIEGDSNIVKDYKVYYLPHVDITMGDGQTFSKFFKNIQDLDTWIEENLKFKKLEL